MCGRYSQTSPVEGLRALFGFDELPNLGARYNIAPTQDVPIIRRDESGAREFASIRWGLVPAWAKEIGGSAPLINARAETIAEKPSFRDAFQRKRCLVPSDGFYEWKTENGEKQAYRIALPDNEPFVFAGIWEQWRSAQGEMLESCAIVTTDSSAQITEIHHRMPVILSPATYEEWLATPSSALLAPYAGKLKAYPIGNAVNKVSNDDRMLWEKVAPKKTPSQLSLL